MRQVLILAGLVFLAVGPISCAEEPRTEIVSNIEADIQAQRNLAEEFDAAVNSGDLERFLRLYAEDAVRLPPGTDVLQGKAAISSAMKQFFDQYDAAHQLVVLDARVSGNLAISRGRWESTDTPKGGGDPLRGTGAWTSIRERQADGSWKTVLEIWNRDSMPSQ